MTSHHEPKPEDLPKSRPTLLPGLGEVLPTLVKRFSRERALGIVLVNAAGLGRIEEAYGHEAHQSAMANLCALVHDVVDGLSTGDDLIVSGETGRHEVLVLIFRAHGDGSFYRSELPALRDAIARAIEQHGQRIAYPYFRKTPVLPVGYAATLRNPALGVETQIRSCLDEVREDAALIGRGLARRRRKNFVGVVMAGEVTSVYEPIVDVATKTVFGYEALARGPEGSEFHSPLVLFEAAQEESLVFELDCLCRQSGLDGAVGLPSGTQLFLNVRPTTIHDPNFKPEALIRTLERTQLRPSDVVFEISEQESIESFAVFREIRDEYRNLGFRFALDDTGAGYASLQAVIELEPDFIKVDRALVAGLDTDPARQALLKALRDVAGGIGAKIIGEGLDTLEELEMLGTLGISFGQGWLFGKPTPLRATS